MVVGVLLFLKMELTVKTVALTFTAFKLEQDMADFELTQQVLDLFSEGPKFAQFLIMHPDMGGERDPFVGEGPDVNIMDAHHFRQLCDELCYLLNVEPLWDKFEKYAGRLFHHPYTSG